MQLQAAKDIDQAPTIGKIGSKPTEVMDWNLPFNYPPAPAPDRTPQAAKVFGTPWPMIVGAAAIVFIFFYVKKSS